MVSPSVTALALFHLAVTAKAERVVRKQSLLKGSSLAVSELKGSLRVFVVVFCYDTRPLNVLWS